jgi:hypothetical protein
MGAIIKCEVFRNFRGSYCDFWVLMSCNGLGRIGVTEHNFLNVTT